MRKADPSDTVLCAFNSFNFSLKVNMQVLMRRSQQLNLAGKEKLLNF